MGAKSTTSFLNCNSCVAYLLDHSTCVNFWGSLQWSEEKGKKNLVFRYLLAHSWSARLRKFNSTETIWSKSFFQWCWKWVNQLRMILCLVKSLSMHCKVTNFIDTVFNEGPQDFSRNHQTILQHVRFFGAGICLDDKDTPKLSLISSALVCVWKQQLRRTPCGSLRLFYPRQKEANARLSDQARRTRRCWTFLTRTKQW